MPLVRCAAHVCSRAHVANPVKRTRLSARHGALVGLAELGWAGRWRPQVSALATFALVGAPALRSLAGHPVGSQRMPRVRCVLETAIKLDRERPEYHRAALTWRAREGRYSAASTGRQISSRLGSFRGAAALLELPRGAGELAAGTEVSALLLGELGAAPTSDAAMPALPAKAPLVTSAGTAVGSSS